MPPMRSIVSQYFSVPCFHLARQRLDEVRPAERIDDVGDAALVRDDLLRAQRDGRRFLGRQRQRLVQRVGVQRVGAAQHAASACSAVRTTLLYGCCAVSDTPAVCVWKRSCHDRGFLAPNRSRIASAQSLRAARYLAISSKKSLCELKKNEMRGTNSSTSRPGVDAVLHVLEPVTQREGELLQRGRARLADVIAAHRDRVPLRHVLARRTQKMSVTSRIDGRGGKMYSFCAMNSFRMSF